MAKVKDIAKQKIPLLDAGQIANKAIDIIDKQKKYAIAKDTSKQFGLITTVLLKHQKRIKTIEDDNKAKAVKEDGAGSKNSIAALQSSMNTIATSLGIMNNILSKALTGKEAPAVAATEEPTKPGAPQPGAKAEKQEGLFGLVKSLFSNPAVLAAMAGIVYTVLPKETQEKVKALLGGFASGLEDAMGRNENEGLSGFNTALKVAGVALTTYFGAKMISSIAGAITTTLKIVKILGAGSLKRGAAVVAVGAAAGAAAMMGGKKAEGEEAGAAEPVSPEELGAAAPEAEAKPSPAGTGVSPGAGVGLKPGVSGAPGLKVPPMTGEDKPVMDMIKRHEGVRTKPYKDSLGLWTVGVGHLIGDGKSLPPEWNRELTMDEVDTLFAKDYKKHKEGAEKGPGYDKANAAGRAALIDLAFNMGNNWHKNFKQTSAALERGDFQSAAEHLKDSKWYSQVGNRAKTIVAMIQGGGKGEGSMLVSSSGEPVVSGTGEIVRTGTTAGQDINAMSQNVRDAARPSSGMSVSNVDNSTRGSTKKQEMDVQRPIPSPIASRGSLTAFTKHSTAYA